MVLVGDETTPGIEAPTTIHQPVPEPEVPLAYSEAIELPEPHRSHMPVALFAAAVLALTAAGAGRSCSGTRRDAARASAQYAAHQRRVKGPGTTNPRSCLRGFVCGGWNYSEPRRVNSSVAAAGVMSRDDRSVLKKPDRSPMPKL
jgi:hypothetical protein